MMIIVGNNGDDLSTKMKRVCIMSSRIVELPQAGLFGSKRQAFPHGLLHGKKW